MSEAVAETAAVEETAAPETVEETESVEESTKEQVEEVIYAGKYKTAEELEKGYKEMQSLYNSRYKGFTGAPEDGKYEYSTDDESIDVEALMESPMIQRLKERGIESEMSNDLFNGIINDYINTQREENAMIIEHEKSKLGEDAEKRLENLVDKLSTKYDGEKLEGIKAALINAEIIEALEDQLNEKTNTVAPVDAQETSPDKEAELQELWAAKDERGRRKMEYDADYRSMVNKKWKAYYGE